VWDLRVSGPTAVPNARGPFVLPGTYQLHLTAGADRVSAPVRVDWDPEFPLSDEERASRFRFLTEAGTLQGRIHTAGSAVADARTQLTSVQDQLKNAGAAARAVDTATRFAASLDQVQRRIGGGGGGDEEGGGSGLRTGVNGLINEIDGSGVQQGTLSGPTAVQSARLAAAGEEVEKLSTEVDRVLGAELRQVNDQIGRLKIPAITVSWPAARSTTSSQP
jgi:hypothetical protein